MLAPRKPGKALERQHNRANNREVAEFLATRPRNISRWLPQIEEREAARQGCEPWSEASRLVALWIRDLAPEQQSPLQVAEQRLLWHLEHSASGMSLRGRAQILGVSVPTYQKRLKQQGG